jgi:hypothetical protein
MNMRNRPHRPRKHMRVLGRMVETLALLAFARRTGIRRGTKLLALATAALLEQEPVKGKRTKGNEAPMIIWPRDVARLLRQLVAAVRGTKK